MGNKELIALLQSLQGPGGGRALNPGLLAQLPALLTTASTETPPAPAASRGGAIASAASTVASSALRGVSGGLTLLPVVSSLLKLFGVGRPKDEPPALEKYELPAPIRAEAGLSQSGETFLIDRGAGDRIRQLPAPGGAMPFVGDPAGSFPVAGSQAGSNNPGAGASITVNVQAMDSQSFMDRREDIARAVREAMLQSHSLNDVVSEV